MTNFIRWTVIPLVVLSTALPLLSQSRNTGEIRGTVSAKGAVLPGAKVTLTNINTGEVRGFVTNQDGIYDTVSTPAGTYKITFSAEGFRKLERGPIVLQVNVIAENAELQVGSHQCAAIIRHDGFKVLQDRFDITRRHGSTR